MKKQEIQKFSLYDGKVELTFDTASHIYSIGDKQVYGVTNIVGIMNKPALMYWAVNMTIDYYRKVLTAGQSYSEVDLEDMHVEAKSAHRKSSQQAMFIGTMAHDWIEKWIKSKLNLTDAPERPVDEKVNKSLDAFIKWTEQNQVLFLHSEKKVLSLEHEFAGTLDIEARVGKELGVIDIKTSSGIYDEYWAQTASYLHAREEETGVQYAGAWIVRIDKISGEFEVQFKSRDELEIYWNLFKGCLQVYKSQMAIKNQ